MSKLFEPGSSPLARGTRAQANKVPTNWWLIPARAGNTRPGEQGANELVAHPRSRGEHMKALDARLSEEGSSPLARGTHVAVHDLFLSFGLIPARAGNT